MPAPASARPDDPSRAAPRRRPLGRPAGTGKRPVDRPLLRNVLGDVLRRLRLEQGRTLADVAADAAISVPYLSEVERGRKEASSEVLGALCDALDVPLSAVVGEAGQEIAAELAELARAERVAAVRDLRSRPAASMSLAPTSVAVPAYSSGRPAGQVLALAA
jgi:transcriptional regulator with XRE-family HTH domain